MARDLDPEAMERLQRTFDPMAVAVQLTIRIHRSGAMSVEGPTADPEFCKKMMGEAYAAIVRNQKPEGPKLIIPESDLDSRPKERYGSLCSS